MLFSTHALAQTRATGVYAWDDSCGSETHAPKHSGDSNLNLNNNKGESKGARREKAKGFKVRAIMHYAQGSDFFPGETEISVKLNSVLPSLSFQALGASYS